MSVAEVSIDRTSLGKAPLVIADDGAVYRFTEDGVGYVVQGVRVTTAPTSGEMDGEEIVAFAREATSLPVEFHILADSRADLIAAIAELEEALYRLTYPVTRTVDGAAKTYAGSPCALVPKRAAEDSGVVAAHFDTFSVVIPFPNPNGS